MIITIFYTIAVVALIISFGAVYLALIECFPINWLYYHYKLRKPFVWLSALLLISLTIYISIIDNSFPWWSITPISICLLSIIIAHKLHQENAFKAVDNPEMTKYITTLPIEDEKQLAVIQINNITKCYPLDYVIHHHIVNDTFQEKTISLTYCAMCRSIIAFDVSEIGPLFVGSFKHANMIVADKKTKTFFQQATFKSIIGKLHPYELQPVPFQILEWKEVKEIRPIPSVVKVDERSFRKFELPIPGIWEKIVNSNKTPGLSAKNRDNTFPPRTHVIGVYDNSIDNEVVYIKQEVLEKQIVHNIDLEFYLIAQNNSVNAYKSYLGSHNLILKIESNRIIDQLTSSTWDLTGKHITGEIKEDLTPIAISDEYWFSWIKFHPNSKLIKL